MHCNLRPPEPRQPFSALITTPCRVLEVAEPIHWGVTAANTLLYAVTLIFDTEYVHCIACDVMKFCTKFERNRANRGGVIAV